MSGNDTLSDLGVTPFFPDDGQPQASSGGQGKTRQGHSSHVANADAEWKAISSQPDFCRVGDKVIGFDTTATLDNPVRYSPDVIAAGRSVYRVGDLFRGVQGDEGQHVVSGTSQGSGHVLITSGHDSIKVNGLPLASHDSECRINCDANGVGGAKGYVYTSTRAVSSRPADKGEPLSDAERLKQQAEANVERANELREALNTNPNGKTAAQAQALKGQVEELAQAAQQQQQAADAAFVDGTLTLDELSEVSEAHNLVRDVQIEAGRQVQYASPFGKAVRGAGQVAAETLTPYGTYVDVKDTVGLFSQGRVGASLGMGVLTAVSIIPGVRLVKKGADAVDGASDAARGAEKASDAKQADATPPEPDEGVQVAGKRDNGQTHEEMMETSSSGRVEESATKGVTPNAQQAENLKRFQKKIPSNSKDSVELRELSNGSVAAQATSPGKIPGSKAVYEKQIDINSKTIQATKTTYDPQGNIVHVKDKLNGRVYP